MWEIDPAKAKREREEKENEEYFRWALEQRGQVRIGLLTPPAKPKPPAPPIEPRKVEDPFGPIRIRVVDDATGKPISGVKISFWGDSLPSIITNNNGLAEKPNTPGRLYIAECPAWNKIRLDQALEFVGEGENPINPRANQLDEKENQANNNQVSSRETGSPPELIIINLLKHKVKKGDTLLSIIKQYYRIDDFEFMSDRMLAYFNWGVSSHREVLEKMRDVVGCTKTDQKGNYVFDDSDNPGIIYLPKRWQKTDVSIYETHTIRVKKVKPATCAHIVKVRLHNEQSSPLTQVPYRASLNGEEIKTGTTNSGWAEIPVLQAQMAEPILVEWGPVDSEGNYPYANQLVLSNNKDDEKKQNQAMLRNLGYCLENESNETESVINTFCQDYSIKEAENDKHTITAKEKLQSIFTGEYDATRPMPPTEPELTNSTTD
jgi:hypothetical protein